MTVDVGNQDITLIRRVESGRDAHGNTIWSTARETVDGCSVQPFTSTETLLGGAQVQGRRKLFAPAGLNLDSVDAVEVGGVQYEIDGDAPDWPDLSGAADHVEAILRRVTG